MERFPIENEELLSEDANQVEVYYQEPQDYDTFEKRVNTNTISSAAAEHQSALV